MQLFRFPGVQEHFENCALLDILLVSVILLFQACLQLVKVSTVFCSSSVRPVSAKQRPKQTSTYLKTAYVNILFITTSEVVLSMSHFPR